MTCLESGRKSTIATGAMSHRKRHASRAHKDKQVKEVLFLEESHEDVQKLLNQNKKMQSEVQLQECEELSLDSVPQTDFLPSSPIGYSDECISQQKSTPDTNVAESTPDTNVAESTPDTNVAESTPDTNVAESTPDTNVAESTPDTNVAESTPDTNVAESMHITSHSMSSKPSTSMDMAPAPLDANIPLRDDTIVASTPVKNVENIQKTVTSFFRNVQSQQSTSTDIESEPWVGHNKIINYLECIMKKVSSNAISPSESAPVHAAHLVLDQEVIGKLRKCENLENVRQLCDLFSCSEVEHAVLVQCTPCKNFLVYKKFSTSERKSLINGKLVEGSILQSLRKGKNKVWYHFKEELIKHYSQRDGFHAEAVEFMKTKKERATKTEQELKARIVTALATVKTKAAAIQVETMFDMVSCAYGTVGNTNHSRLVMSHHLIC